MLFVEKESNLITFFQELKTSDIMLVQETEDVQNIVCSVHNPTIWGKWTDSSAKDVPPPDFYSDELNLMMEVMRVDDHGFKKRGNMINPTYEKEHQLEKQLRDSGILDMFPNAELFITAKTELPTDQDHNYKYYLENFKRTLENHIKKIPKYRENHPNHKIIFFIFDESSAYIETDGTIPTNNIMTSGKPHFFMFDNAFIDVFQNTDIDYVIWYTPYKRFECILPKLELPKACIYKVGAPLPATYTYTPLKMISTER